MPSSTSSSSSQSVLPCKVHPSCRGRPTIEAFSVFALVERDNSYRCSSFLLDLEFAGFLAEESLYEASALVEDLPEGPHIRCFTGQFLLQPLRLLGHALLYVVK